MERSTKAPMELMPQLIEIDADSETGKYVNDGDKGVNARLLISTDDGEEGSMEHSEEHAAEGSMERSTERSMERSTKTPMELIAPMELIELDGDSETGKYVNDGDNGMNARLLVSTDGELVIRMNHDTPAGAVVCLDYDNHFQTPIE